MKHEDFKDLLKSIKEFRAIKAGKRKPSRVIRVLDPNQPVGKLTKIKDFLPPPKKLKVCKPEQVDHQVALDRLHDKDDAILSSSKLRKRLGL